MNISPKLQSHFNNIPLNKRNLEIRLWELAKDIDPMFIDSFNSFRGKLLWIIVDNPESEDIVLDEVNQMKKTLKTRNNSYGIQLWASIIDSVQ